MDRIDFLGEDSFSLIEHLLERKQYLRELAEDSKLAPSSVHKIMQALLSRKMVLAEQKKNRKIFRLNYDSPLTTGSLALIFINKIINSKSFRKLKKLKPVGVYLFGTAASGKMTADSDIDLAVYFEKKPDSFELSQIKRELSSELKREVQLITFTKAKLESMRKENTELLQQIKNKGIVLGGEMLE